MNSVLVAGLGNEMRGDDAAGLLTARALRALRPSDVDVEEYGDDTAALAEAISRHAHVIVVDAVASSAPAGTVQPLSRERVVTRSEASTHGLGLREALELSRVLGAEPTVHVFGIAGRRFGLGDPPSAEVVRGATELAVAIKEGLACA